jgi:glycosyltransferase involved in cell wall biosynthesis
MSKLQRAAFVRIANWPAANESTYQALRAAFPEVSFDLIEINRELKGQYGLIIRNTIETARLYGPMIARRKRSFRECFFRTGYIFDQLKRLLRRRLGATAYSFTFQMQSIFDASQAGVPHFLYTDHTHLANLLYPDFDRSKMYHPSWIERERSIYRNTAMNFVRSSNIRSSLIEQYKLAPERVTCVYVGSNTTDDQPLNVQKYASKNILFVGLDWERKGGPELVAAFRQVLATHPDATLTIVGASPQLDLPNCRVVGRVPLKEVSGFYEQAAIFCMPTRIEPFGVVFVEAMSHRLPLVAMRTGAVPDFVVDGQTGRLLELNDVDGLAAALRELLGNPERCREMGEQAYQLARERYSWPNVARAMRGQIEPLVLGAPSAAA